jgi:hypothetical protein
MASALTNTISVPTGASIAGFRLGEDQISDASDSDSDQSAHSERSLSPSRTTKPKSRSKKKKDRQLVGALTDELGTLLGEAFQGPNGDAAAAGAASGR